MAQKKQKPARKTPVFGPRPSDPRPFIGLVFLILGLLVALAVGDYRPTQNPAFHSDVQDNNLIGIFGVKVAYGAFYLLGLAAYAIPVLAFWLAYMFFRPFSRKVNLGKLPPLLLVYVSLAVFGAMYQIESMPDPGHGSVALETVSDNFHPYGWGGFVGFWIYAGFLREFLGMVGSLVVFG
ncbi:MAG TPA: DNA translocase FtsK 4TM domain-containing protein, partial [Oceanipulchritudo sp.]|nr:DNA translocase FtsK 4TM domain-containing protein [Oceanipulchritudo sp.]